MTHLVLLKEHISSLIQIDFHFLQAISDLMLVKTSELVSESWYIHEEVLSLFKLPVSVQLISEDVRNLKDAI
jgi:hypothetical protein